MDDFLSDIDIDMPDSGAVRKNAPVVKTAAEELPDEHFGDDIIDMEPAADRYSLKYEEFDPSAASIVENLDGSGIDEEEDKKELSAASARMNPREEKQSIYDSVPDEPADTDPFDCYKYADEGRQRLKVIAVIVAVISAFALIVHIARGRGTAAFGAAFRIFAAFMMMKGHNWARIVMIVSFAAMIYSDFFLMFADVTSSVPVTSFYIVMYIIHAFIGVVLLKDPYIKAFFGKW